MARVNFEVLVASMKTLGIIFIFAISISSFFLLIKLIRLHGDTFNLRRTIVSILTCGTLLFAFFPLVVNVRVQFQPMEVSCKSLLLASEYENFFFPFVYALSLIVLAIELYMMKRRSTRSQSVLLRVIFVTSPWIIACIFVIPLTLAGADFYTCYETFTLPRHRAIVWICNLLPAITVLLVAIFLAFKVGGEDDVYTYDSSVTSSSSTQRVVHSSSSSSSYGGGFQQAGYTSNHPVGVVSQGSHPRPDSSHFHQAPHEYPSVPPPYQAVVPYQTHQPYRHQPPSYQHSIVDTNHHHHHHHQQHHHQKQQQQQLQQHHHQPPPQYPPPPPPNYAPPPPGFGTPFYEYDPSIANPQSRQLRHHHPHAIQQSQSFPHSQVVNGSHTNTNTSTTVDGHPAVPIFRDLRNEAKTFAKVTALFVFCSLPKGIFNLAYSMNRDRVEMDRMSETVIAQLVYWFSVLRWLVLAICWFVSIK